MEENKNTLPQSEDVKKSENKEKKPASTPKPQDKKKLTVIIAAAAVAVIALVAILVIVLGNGGAKTIPDGYYYFQSADSSVCFEGENRFTAYVFETSSCKLIEGSYKIKRNKISFTTDAAYGGQTKTYSIKFDGESFKIDDKSPIKETILDGLYITNGAYYSFNGKNFIAYYNKAKINGVYTVLNGQFVSISTMEIDGGITVPESRDYQNMEIGEGYIIIDGIKLFPAN